MMGQNKIATIIEDGKMLPRKNCMGVHKATTAEKAIEKKDEP